MSPRPLRVAQWVRIRWWNACAYYAVALAEGLARLGHGSFLLAPPGTPAFDEARRRGLATPEVGDPGSGRPWEWSASGRRLRRFLEEEEIDAVNVHSGPGHARLSRLCRARGIVLTRTRGSIQPVRTGMVQRWLYREGTDHHFVSADFLRAPYAELGVPEERVTTLHGGTDLALADAIDRDTARSELRRRLGLAPDQPVVGMVARLSPVKGHEDVLRAFAVLRARYPRAHLVCAGGEAQLTRRELEGRAEALGVGARVHFVGRVDDPLAWAAGFDVAVIASTGSEAICRSAFEYLAVGTPIVATRLHAIAEVLSDEVAVLVPPGRPAALAEGLSRLLGDAGLRSELAGRGTERVRRRYSLEAFAGEAAAVLAGLVRRNAAGGRP